MMIRSLTDTRAALLAQVSGKEMVLTQETARLVLADSDDSLGPHIQVELEGEAISAIHSLVFTREEIKALQDWCKRVLA